MAAGGAAFLQWRATRDQTRASLFEQKYAAFKALKDELRKAYLHGGQTGDVDVAKEAAHKLKFLFSPVLLSHVDDMIERAYRVVDERMLSTDGGGNRTTETAPHYDAMAAEAKALGEQLSELDALFARELGHAPGTTR
jgi:hypothetical protein